MAKYRAVFVAMPPLLSDIVSDVVSGQVDLDLVAQFNSVEMLIERLPALEPDLVLIGLRAGERDDIARSILRLAPAAKVIAISSDCHHAYVHEMPWQRSVLDHFSLASLLAEIVGPPSNNQN